MAEQHAFRTTIMAGTVLAGLATGASAQSADADAQAVTLDTVTIEAGTETRTGDFAGTATTTTTTREAIENRSIETIEDLGRREEAGITFNRANRSINVRGLDGARVLTTIDGIRVPYLADATRGASGGVDAFDFNSLSAVHLTRGADPTLGSGALGGVLSFRTLEPEDLLKGRRLGAFTRNGYDSADGSWFASGAAAMRHGDTSILLQGGYRQGSERDTGGDVGGIGATRTEPNPLDSEQFNVLGKIYRDLGEGHRFGLTAEAFRRREDIETLTTQTATGIYRAGNHGSGEDVDRRRLALTYDYEAPEPGAGFVDQAAASLYYQSLERSSTVEALRSSAPVGRFARDNSLAEDAVGFLGHAARDWQFGTLANRLTVGAELRAATQTQYSAGVDGCRTDRSAAARRACALLHTNQADSPEVDGRAVGLFAANETALLDGRFRVTPGLRYDWYEEAPQSTPEFTRNASFRGLPQPSTGDALSPKFLAEYDLLPGFTVFGQWTQGFRAPTAGELYARFGGPGTYLRLGNPELDAETSNGFDAGIRLDQEVFGAFITAFHTDYENFIDTVQVSPPGGEYPLGGISSLRNIPQARIAGVELGGHVRFAEHWTARGSLAYADGRNRTDGTWLNSVPPLTAIVGLGFERATWGGEVSAKLAAERDRVSGTGFRAPGYGVVDATAWIEPERLPGLKIAGGVFNLFDKTYYDAVAVPLARSQPDAFYSEPGRSVRLNVSYRF
ncbi:TonB-dependent hemoglobin/transferrin/lactoferrin family receptor [Aureimonas sp. SK2]|uniref:TonB-dependent hemoglobin/transferrin/lactoferrin family receptor n=1 Tax=Aureimonas sp. SK2 TaxID=3015992 RepID=UPI002444A71F|nr:TonB-dependent hemoglobin/transferrin/lactoferrin family receptor [Aureimonas sp. SK2]